MKVTQDGHALAQGAERATALDGLTVREVPDPRGRLGLSWVGAAQYAGLLAQLVLCLLVIRQFQLESRAFYKVALLVVGGFAVHALLPLRYRLPFFVVLSLGSIVAAFNLVAAAWLIAVSAVLIGICHLPMRLAARVALLLGVGALLAVSRTDLWPAPWAANIWPIIGSMFMFRLALYLYALQHDATPPTAARTLAYFWMVPNVCFPLFPVVDYSTFHRTYYDTDAVSIYQTGVRWIVRGLTHLLLYRLVYLHLPAGPGQLTDLGDLVWYLLGTFLLYLRVSGQFHLIVGMLNLFGFHLPETHRLYYLASSFNDFWRRINIYWKDFMMKLVYYPSFFRLRRLGERRALILATMIVFAATWLLHSYQWFWLRGGFPLTLTDGLFWGVLGALVVVNTLRESHRPRARRLATDRWSASLALRTVGTFCAICVLWSLWSADSVSDWLGIWEAAGRWDVGDLALVAGLLAAGLVVAGRAWRAPRLGTEGPQPFYRHPAIPATAMLLALLTFGRPVITHRLPPEIAATIDSLKVTTLSARDAELLHKGYYERLDNPSRLSTQLWDAYRTRPPEWRAGPRTVKLYQDRSDFLLGELRPSVNVMYHGAPLSTNRWGMRDRDYGREKPPGVHRIALLGPSLTMGPGVDDSLTFDALLEDRLNREPANPHVTYEVLNFGVLRYSLLQQLAQLEERVVTFQPDVVMITGHPTVAATMTDHLMEVMTREVPIPYDSLRSMLATARIEPGSRGVSLPSDGLRSLARWAGMEVRQPTGEAERRLALAEPAITAWTLARIAAVCRQHDAVPVFLGLGTVQEPPGKNPRLIRQAEAAGFVVLNLYDIYDNQNRDSLRLAEWDRHPNVRGMRLIADRLYRELRRRESELRLGPTAAAVGQTPGENRDG
jgi:hypothetical protein